MTIEPVCKVAEMTGPLLCPFFDVAAEMNLGVVVIGGFLGGFLQPAYARLSKELPDPPAVHFLWTPLLGVAAAGISVYVVANSVPTATIRLLFFSLLCGLAFPAVLASAVDGLTRRTEDVQRNVADIAKAAESNEVANTSDAAERLRRALSGNHADQIGVSGVPVVEATGQTAVRNIAETAKVDPSTASEVIIQLRQVGAVAETAGYPGIVRSVARQLNKLSELQIDPALITLAKDSAKHLDVPE